MSDGLDDARERLKPAEARAAGVVRSATSDGALAKPARPVRSVTDARADLVAALAELDEALSIKGSMRRHPVAWAAAGGLAALGLAGALVWAFRKR